MEGLYFDVKPCDQRPSSPPPPSPLPLTPNTNPPLPSPLAPSPLILPHNRTSFSALTPSPLLSSPLNPNTHPHPALTPSRLNLTPNRWSYTTLTPTPSPLHLTPLGRNTTPTEEEEVQYRLTLVGCLPVHPLTTMAMLPWVVAEIGRPRPGEREKPVGVRPPGSPASRDARTGNGGGLPEARSVSSRRDQTVCLCVSASWVRCVWTEEVERDRRPWDPLTHTLAVLFECRPHSVIKLLHNSREPCSFGCLVRDARLCYCYVFQCQDCTKVPEIISKLRQAGKSSARNDDLTAPKPAASSSEDCTSSTSAVCTATMFTKRFEVLFCGRVTVAHKKAPPALIDECIEKFSQSVGAGGGPKPESGGGLVDGLLRALTFPTLKMNGGIGDGGFGGGGYGGGRPVLFKSDPSFPCLRALDENGLSPELHTHPAAGVQPTSLQGNRTMLFMVGRSQIFLVSPDTKKVSIEKSFREISFCSQVDEIMLTLKQAFSVAALQQSERTRSQQCASCPMQQLHRLCERIEGLHPSKAKLEFQKHLATLDNQEQADRASPKSD
ncbi:TBC1 domain family member 1, partial [Salmo trutta]|uniref:TBC1 domain family member 1 n=1 Tax=Salmo trutta TaxID=8032 RepID=UPI0011312166